MKDKELKLLEKQFLMRIDDNPTGRRYVLVYPIYIDERTGDNVCYLPMEKVKIHINLNLSGNGAFEWTRFEDLIEYAKPVFKQKVYSNTKLTHIAGLKMEFME